MEELDTSMENTEQAIIEEKYPNRKEWRRPCGFGVDLRIHRDFRTYCMKNGLPIGETIENLILTFLRHRQ